MSNQNIPTDAELADIADNYLIGSRIDYIGLWEIPIRLGHDFEFDDPIIMKQTVLRLVEEMVKRGLEPVNFVRGQPGCIPWKEKDVASIIARISAEWDALGRDPSVSDIVWFNNPALDA